MIVLALVARGAHILCETHAAAHERFLEAAQTILARIPPNASKLSYAFETWLFHYVSQDGLVYLAVADAHAGRRIPFAFLARVQQQFVSLHQSPIDETGVSNFTSTLQRLVDEFNAQPHVDPVVQAKSELAGVKDIMSQNVEHILSRGERIQLLVDRTDNAASQSMAFRRRAAGLRRQMWWKNTKVLALAGFSTFVLLFFLYGLFH
jgi:vesicle-associated membrane protein 7